MDRLKPFLDAVVATYQREEFLDSDPIGLVHARKDRGPHECEVAAILSAVLAYGNVKQIRRSAEGLFARMDQGQGLVGFLSAWHAVRADRRRLARERRHFGDWVHRFTRVENIFGFFDALASSRSRWGSVGQELASQLQLHGGALEPALEGMLTRWEACSGGDYLITRPSRGSACKRWVMLCRWMGRRDAIDLGLWMTGSPLLDKGVKGLEPHQLLMPLDTHTGRLSQMLGLTQRRNLGWLAVREVTEALKLLDPTDPVRYDFALARLGILDLCQGRFRWQICSQCAIQPVCSVGSSSRHSSTDSPHSFHRL